MAIEEMLQRGGGEDHNEAAKEFVKNDRSGGKVHCHRSASFASLATGTFVAVRHSTGWVGQTAGPSRGELLLVPGLSHSCPNSAIISCSSLQRLLAHINIVHGLLLPQTCCND